MCYPMAAEYSQLIKDRCVECARSKIDRGLIDYHFECKYAWDVQSGKKVVVDKVLIEKWKD